MKLVIRWGCVVLLAFAVASCTMKRPYMVAQEAGIKPSPGKALVNFVRPSGYGRAAKATLWDGDKLIGVSFGKQRFQYECEPGKHLFIAWSEYKSPVEAELLPDRVYYIALRIRMGAWRGRIHQVPLNPGHELWKEIMAELPSLPNYAFDPNAIGTAEAEEKEKIVAYLSYYEKEVKGTEHVLILRAEDGIIPQ
jgi:hypothetical protein